LEHPDVKSALEAVEEFVTADGPVAGIHVVEPDLVQLRSALDRGYRFVGFASEMLIFSHRMAEVAAALAAVR
jgi:2-keto-3-deoxy-L-rhamnonate aldolase RhmA